MFCKSQTNSGVSPSKQLGCSLIKIWLILNLAKPHQNFFWKYKDSKCVLIFMQLHCLLSYWQFSYFSINKNWKTYPRSMLPPGSRNWVLIYRIDRLCYKLLLTPTLSNKDSIPSFVQLGFSMKLTHSSPVKYWFIFGLYTNSFLVTYIIKDLLTWQDLVH